MKKNFLYAMMSAIALSGAVSFSACSSNEELTDNNVIKTEDIGKSTTTQFALNIGRATGGSTRSTSIITQQDGNNFRGMDNIWLIPMSFRQAKGGALADLATNGFAGPDVTFNNDQVYSGVNWATIIYNLGAISSSEISAVQSSKIYSLTLPVGTNNFLFYGKAIQSTLTTNVYGNDQDALNGKLTIHIDEDNTEKAADITAELGKIATGNWTSAEQELLAIINGVANVGIPNSLLWKDLDRTNNNNKTLIQAYDNLVTIGASEVRAGSAEAIRSTLQELYRTVLEQSRVGQTQDVKDMAMAIRNKIQDHFDVFFDKTANDHNVFDTPITGADNDAKNNTIDEKSGTDYVYPYYAAYLKYSTSNYSPSTYQFPFYQGLPAGAARLANVGTDGPFRYANEATGAVTGNVSGSEMVDNYTFPAELVYFANSGLRATENNKEIGDYPITVDTWDDPTTLKWSDWDKNVVTSGSRAVAMKNNVNYGVAMLKSTLNLGEAALTNSLMDNREDIVNDGITQDQEISIGTESFILTGVLVGGQPDVVGWDFLPTSTTGYNKVVYDRILDNGTGAAATDYCDFIEYPTESYDKAASKTYSYVLWSNGALKPNYTLLLDNYDPSGNQQVVNVALELINNTGQDFYGRDNIIPAGGTFYLVGQLNPYAPKAGSTIDWDSYLTKGNTDYQDYFPAYGLNRVFAQDHTTIANFSFSLDALKNAYSTVPDLRSIQMLFGLSVDLTWKRGLEFENSL